MKTFKDWLNNQYSSDELLEIAQHGCVSGCAHGMIYYSETSALYQEFADDIHEIVGDYVDSLGEMPSPLLESINSAVNFQNNMVWLATEILAYDLTSELMD